MLHILFVIFIVVIIVIVQLRSFTDTRKKIGKFLRIFPQESNEYRLEKEALIKKINIANEIDLDAMLQTAGFKSNLYHKSRNNEEGVKIDYFLKEKAQEDLIKKLTSHSTNGIEIDHDNETLEVIVKSINEYLSNNKSVSDFHLMKDIVDRNCDAKEEEISTQIPVSLYLGLVGTMAGILTGIFYLWLTGGISNLLSANGESSTRGIEALFGGVAMAMISSISGLLLTTWNSNRFKNAKLLVERDKHNFLSWIQAKLLPTLSDNVVGAINQMTGNLTAFNKEFSNNTSNLGSALAKVNESYQLQTQLLDTVRKIADKNISYQNIELYNVLKNSTSEIGTLAEYLQNCNLYLSNVKELNNKLDNYENRTQFIENASKFYSKHEYWLAENYDEANRKLQEVVGRYNIAIETVFDTIKSDIENKRQELRTFIEYQHNALKSSSGALDKIVRSLSELGEVQKAVKAFESAIKEQNSKLDHLVEHIENLANVKSSGGAIQIHQKTPIWQIAILILITLSSAILAVNSFIKPEKMKVVPSQLVTERPVTTDSTAVVNFPK